MDSRQPVTKRTADCTNSAAFADSLAVHAQAVFAVCLANTKNHHDAEDIMQSVYLKASEKAVTLRDPQRAKSWLLQMARHACVDHYRRHKKVEPFVDEPSMHRDDTDAFCNELHEAIGKLSKQHAEVITLFYLEERSCANVATSLGITESAARQRLVRARAALHTHLQGDDS